MSLAEIKAEFKKLSPAELEELAADLATHRQLADSDWLERIEKNRDEIEAGRFHTAAEFLRKHEELEREGR